MKQVYVTRNIPEVGLSLLRENGFLVDVSKKDGVLTKEELIAELKQKPYDAVLCLLTDKIDSEVFEAVPNAKIFANYAVGFDNIDIKAAKDRGIIITNTPGVLTDAVAEFTIALMMATTKRLIEADSFTREGKYQGWDPDLFVGSELKAKTIGIVGVGRIGKRVLHHCVKGFDMKACYYDLNRDESIEQEYQAQFFTNLDDLLRQSDIVSIHVPLLESTKHLINKEKLSLMKEGAVLINTSRGPVVDEQALVEALATKKIRAAGLDVFEFEPEISTGLERLPNVVLTPHIASATNEARGEMSKIAASNILAVLSGNLPLNQVN